MVSICICIITTRDIGRQIIRHKSFSFQEFSTRYAEVKSLPHVRECRLQDIKNRQNSIEINDEELIKKWGEIQLSVIDVCSDAYDQALKLGIAKEQARSVLPEGLTETTMYMNGTLRSWIHYIQARTKKETQKEHREIALSCAKNISTIFPLIMNFVDKE